MENLTPFGLLYVLYIFSSIAFKFLILIWRPPPYAFFTYLHNNVFGAFQKLSKFFTETEAVWINVRIHLIKDGKSLLILMS